MARRQPPPPVAPADDEAQDDASRWFRMSLAIRLLRAREAVMRRFRPMLAEYELSEQQWRVIRMLSDETAVEAGILAERVALLGPSLTRILHNLEARGLVRRQRQQLDQRKIDVSLTAAGRTLFDSVLPHSRRIYAEIQERIGADQLENLLNALGALTEQLED
jgi:homoprotocatechuate degradation regulator HpaR